MYFSAAGREVLVDIDIFVRRCAQVVMDAAAINSAATAAENVATFEPAAGILPNPPMDGPNFE